MVNLKAVELKPIPVGYRAIPAPEPVALQIGGPLIAAMIADEREWRYLEGCLEIIVRRHGDAVPRTYRNRFQPIADLATRDSCPLGTFICITWTPPSAVIVGQGWAEALKVFPL